MPTDSPATPATTVSEITDFIEIPRIDGLSLSPDGHTVVLSVSVLDTKKTSYVRALWSIPADGRGTPRRLTRSAKGEGGPAFTGSGDVLFVSTRSDADAADAPDGDATAQLWLLPERGGEARAVTRLAGGVDSIAATAAHSDTVILGTALLPSSTSLEDDAARRTMRSEKKVSAILHSSYPIRFWDHDLGPDEPHLLSLDLSDALEDSVLSGIAVGDDAADDAPASDSGDAKGPADASGPSGPSGPSSASDASAAANTPSPTPYPDYLPRPVDLTPTPGRTADTGGQALSPDGGTLLASLGVQETQGTRLTLVAIDVASGSRTTLFDEPGVSFEEPVISPDGARIAYLRCPYDTPEEPGDRELWVANLDGSDARRLAPDWDRWPSSYAFDANSGHLLVAADQNGRGPIFRIALADDSVTQLTDDDYTYTNVCASPDGESVVALRSSYLEPSSPVRIDIASRSVTRLPSPVRVPQTTARLEEVECVASDGARVRAWLLLPEGTSAATPAPLVLWIHGGPLNSWNAWSWRWNPLLLVQRGYAVLLPDPALSTGYGLDFIRRGWNSWGDKPYTDLMSITDAAETREDIDETRTTAMGGSFGGYMANWIAGHTDRFSCIVSHASLWAMDQFVHTTDSSYHWLREFTPEALEENSPHRSVDRITTPMLVVHGDKDYRVPIGESLRLWSELTAHSASEDGTSVHRFLFYPDENHWILKPQHSVVWYQTVLAFLDEHVHGAAWKRPELLG